MESSRDELTKIKIALFFKLPMWYKKCWKPEQRDPTQPCPICGEFTLNCCIIESGGGPDRITKLKEPCPVCGQNTLYCLRHDFGRIDCEPHFTHICVNESCPYVIETEIQGVSYPDIETRVDYCPWCKK